MTPERRSAQFLAVATELIDIPQNARILDLGCGNGDLVFEFRKRKLKAFGCDFKFKEGNNVKILHNENIIRLVGSPYHLPFENNSFDIIFSDNVFEHVMDYQLTFSEINRVLRPGGGSLHFFSSRYRILEVHKKVPFASIIKRKWWFKLWAYLGIKNNHQKLTTMSLNEIVEDNYLYLNQYTNYKTKNELRNEALMLFDAVIFGEKYFLKHSDRGKYLYFVCRFCPCVSSVYSTFRTRVMFFSKKLPKYE